MDRVNHHYLPQFYLRAWAGPDGQVLRYVYLPTGQVHEKPVRPRGTGFERDLDTAPPAVHWERYDPNIIETQVMSPIDNDAALVHTRLLSGNPVLSKADRTAWALFLTSLVHRHRDGIRDRDAAAPALAAQVLAELLANYEGDEDRTRVIDALGDADLEQVARSAHRTVMVQRIRASDAIAGIEALAWTVVVIDPFAPPLLTTDRPLLVNLGRGGAPQLMSLPLSPTRLFVAYAPSPNLGAADPAVPSLLEQLAFGHDFFLLNEQPCRFVYSSRRLDDNGVVGGKVLRLRTAMEQALARWSDAQRAPSPA